MMESSIQNYKEIACQSRLKCLDLVYRAQTSHIGSLMSCADIMAVLFEKIDLDKDKFVLSAGWKAAMLYYHLWRKGRITEEELNSYCQKGSKWIGLSEPIHPDIPIAGGSMGLSLPAAVGLALAKKLKGEEGKVYVLVSDGEMQCGTTWEAALIAAHYKLDNLIVIVDYNGFQAMGKTNEILNIEPLGDYWESLGWKVEEINGHNFIDIELSLPPKERFVCPYCGGYKWELPIDYDFSRCFDCKRQSNPPMLEHEELRKKMEKPLVIIAHTIKGKGVSFMENNNEWHYRAPEKWEYEKALEELK